MAEGLKRSIVVFLTHSFNALTLNKNSDMSFLLPVCEIQTKTPLQNEVTYGQSARFLPLRRYV